MDELIRHIQRRGAGATSKASFLEEFERLFGSRPPVILRVGQMSIRRD